MLLENKIALVTGAGRGLGKDTAYVLAQEGALVILLGRSEESLLKVKDGISKDGGKADIIQCDLSDDTQILSATESVLNKYNQIDILINNASIAKKLPYL